MDPRIPASRLKAILDLGYLFGAVLLKIQLKIKKKQTRGLSQVMCVIFNSVEIFENQDF
jgi:hypothetical protein